MLDRGEKLKKLAAVYGVGKVTVSDWLRNIHKVEKSSKQYMWI